MGIGDLHSPLPIFRAVAERNLDTARRRYLRARGDVMDTGDVTLEDGIISPEPSDDEPTPIKPAPPH